MRFILALLLAYALVSPPAHANTAASTHWLDGTTYYSTGSAALTASCARQGLGGTMGYWSGNTWPTQSGQCWNGANWSAPITVSGSYFCSSGALDSTTNPPTCAPALQCSLAAGSVAASGFWNIGTDPATGQANFPTFSCFNNCQVTFNSKSLASALVAGVKTYFYEGSLIVAGGTPQANYCATNNQTAGLGSTPAPTCPTGQSAGYINGVQLCYTPASPPAAGSAPPVTTTTTKATTANPDQSSTTTTTSNNGDGSKTITTVTTDPNGNTSTTQQKIAPPDPVAANDFCAANPSDPSCVKKSECEKNPKAVGCAELGDVPNADDIGKKDIPIVFTPVAIPENATCPAPINFTVGGHHMSLDYAPLCQYAAGIRPVFLAMAYLSAALIMIGGIRENS